MKTRVSFNYTMKNGKMGKIVAEGNVGVSHTNEECTVKDLNIAFFNITGMLMYDIPFFCLADAEEAASLQLIKKAMKIKRKNKKVAVLFKEMETQYENY